MKRTVSILIFATLILVGAVMASCEEKGGLHDYKMQDEQQW